METDMRRLLIASLLTLTSCRLPVMAIWHTQCVDCMRRHFEVHAVPEPSVWALMFVGVGMVGAVMRRRGAVA
jgi:uncharacterized membrane protein YidH (DUF202 family)